MHPIILASSMGVPVIGLGKEFKMRDYLNDARLGKYYMPLMPFDYEICINMFDQLVLEYDIASKNLEKALAGLHVLSYKNILLLKDLPKKSRK